MARVVEKVLAAGLLLAASAVAAQPTIHPNGVVNAASFLSPGLPGGAVAQGSLFSVFGTDLGKEVSVEILTSDGIVIPAPVFYSGPTQINAALSAEVPAGLQRLRVVRDGVPSGYVSFKVVRQSFGIFENAGIAAAQIVEGEGVRLATRERPAKPGDVLTLWGTGLGPGLADVTALVGGVAADILYQGPSGCCVGVDQINLILPPEAPLGCFTPVVVVDRNGPSNFSVLPTSADGLACLPIAEPKPLRIYLRRAWNGDEPADSAAASGYVWRLDPTVLPPRGTCVVEEFFSPTSIEDLPAPPDTTAVNGPAGTFQLLAQDFFQKESPPSFLGPGFYEVQSNGGSYPAFRADLLVPPAPLWTNEDALPEDFRLDGLPIEWLGGGPKADVIIWSRPLDGPVDLICRVAVADGSFTVPREALANLSGDQRVLAVGATSSAELEFETDGPETGRLVYHEEFLGDASFGAPRLASTPVRLPGGGEIQAELAASFSERQTGLMFRRNLPSDRGMLFLFETSGVWRFWMKNTLIPLDIIWLDDDRRIIYIERDTPPCPPELGSFCPTYGPNEPSRFVLEIASGEASRRGLEIGDQLDW